jgi:hypothetical protein
MPKQPGNAISSAMSGSEIATAWMCRSPGQLRNQAGNPTRRSDRTTPRIRGGARVVVTFGAA